MSLGGLLGAIFTGGRYGGGNLGPTGKEEILSWRDERTSASQWPFVFKYDPNSDPYLMAQAQRQQEIWNSQQHLR
jgi:hypothetical protein